jgi:hypothetical protein
MAGSGGSMAGSGGKGGGSADAGDAADACNFPNVIKTAPTVSATIAVPTGATLVGGYYAEGNQIYTCVANAEAGAPSEAGSSDGSADAAPAAAGGTWANTAEATLYGDNCATAGSHSYTAVPGSPMWTAKDGSTITAKRVQALAAPVPDGGDGGVTAIAWVLLQATSNTGEGNFANVTYVQRLNTTGGVGPSGACDPTSDANATRKVPYTATYYFYTGGNSEAGTTEGGASEAGEASATPEASAEASTPEAGGGD